MTPGPWLMQEPLPGIDGMPIAILGPDGKRLVAQVFTGVEDAKLIRCAADLAAALGDIAHNKSFWNRFAIESVLRRAGVEVKP